MVDRDLCLEGYVIENEGDLNIGTLLWLKQCHKIPDFMVESLPSGDTNHSYLEERRRIIVCQYKILLELDRLGILDVFPEETYENLVPDDAGRVSLLRNCWLEREPEGSKAELLYQFGAHVIYAGINPQVTLHRTITRREAKKIDELAREHYKTIGEVPDSPIMEPREISAIREMDCFFSQNRGVSAVLVFGEGHDFNHSWPAAPPRIYSKCFDVD